MNEAVTNLNRGMDHLATVEALCGTIRRRIDEGNITSEWLSGVAGIIKANSLAAAQIISAECAVQNGFSREFVAAIDEGIAALSGDSPRPLQVRSRQGNIVRIGQPEVIEPKGDDCA